VNSTHIQRVQRDGHPEGTPVRLLLACVLMLVMSAAAAVEPKIATGYAHTLHLNADGTVWAWGLNDSGQLGDGTALNRSVPVQVLASAGTPLTGIIDIAAGDGHSAAITSDGRVLCWGLNDYGQLGNGTTSNSSYPVQLSLTRMAEVSAGAAHSIARDYFGRVYAWGRNNYGQLGNNSSVLSSSSPVSVVNSSSSELLDAIAISAGTYHNLALRYDGTVVSWGMGTYGQLGINSSANSSAYVVVQQTDGSSLAGVKAVCAGGYHSLFLTAAGQAWAAGRNDYGQLGLGDESTRSRATQTSMNYIKALGAGRFHSQALWYNGAMLTWGLNTSGQLGNGSTTNSSSAVYPGMPAAARSLGTGSGSYHTMAITASGLVFGFGANINGQLGAGTSGSNLSSSQLTTITWPQDGLIQVEAGLYHTVALRTDGTVWAWGRNIDGELGINAAGSTANPDAVQVQRSGGSVLTDIVAVSTGGATSFALDVNGSVYAWGDNGDGQCGQYNSLVDQLQAVRVDMSSGGTDLYGIVAIAGGRYHAAALRYDGSVWAWGTNANGQLGDGLSSSRQYAQQGKTGSSTTLYGVKQIAVGLYHTMALGTNGQVHGTGYNGYGQLGDGTVTGRYYFTAATTNNNGVFDLSCGTYHSVFAREVNSKPWATGYNAYGQLGDLGTTNRSTIDGVNGAQYILAVAAGAYHGLALTGERWVRSWGYNFYGQLGNGESGSDKNQLTAVAVQLAGGTSLSRVHSIAAGTSHSLALMDDARVMAWGYNGYGGLGDGSTAQRANPTYATGFWLPAVSISAQDASASEDALDPATFRISRSGGAQNNRGALRVNYGVTGTATAGDDYSTLTGWAVIPDGAGYVDVAITPINNAIAEATEGVTLTLQGDAARYRLGTSSAGVSIYDNDAAGYSVSPASGLTTTELGGQATFTIKLTSQPTADVTIGLSSNDTTEGAVSPSSLTFTASNWSSTQTVTVTGVNDAVDDGNIAYSIVTAAATSSDAFYNGLNPIDVTVANTDDDTAGYTITSISRDTTEAGVTATFTIKLNSQPTATVTIGLSSSDTTEGTVSPSSVAFTTSNYAVAQTVTVTGVNDAVADGNIVYSIITAASTGSDATYNAINPADVTAKNIDDDIKGVTITPSGGSTTPTEGGATDSYTVVLTSQPTATVTISIAGTGSDVSLSASSLTFTTATWNMAQTVTVTAIDDDLYETVAQNSVTLTHSASGGDYTGLAIAAVGCTVTDNDPTPTLAVADASAAEGDTGSSTRSVSITLTGKSELTIGVAYAGADDDAVSGTDYTITAGNLSWAVGETGAKTVTATILGDWYDETDETFRVVLSGATNATIADAAATVTIVDNDTAGFVISAISGTTTEAGGTATFTVRLASQPTASVSLGVATSDGTEGSVSTSSLLFKEDTWSTDQTVTVTGVDDNIKDGTIAYTILLTLQSSADTKYAGLDPADVSTSNSDNDVPGVVCTPSGVAVTEGGSTASYTVRLSSQPAAGVLVTVASDSVLGVRVDTDAGTAGNQNTLAFTTANWNIDRSVSVVAVDDGLYEGTPHASTITHTAASTDGDFQGLTATVGATVTDNDALPVVSISGTTVTEGSSGTVTATLTVTPTNGSTSGFSVAWATTDGTAKVSDGDYTAAGGTLSWAAGESGAKTVSITVQSDTRDEDDETVAVALSGPTGCTLSAASSATLTISDDDAPPSVTLTASATSIAEASGASTVTATLSTASSRTVTVNLGFSGTAAGGDYSAAVTTISIPAGSTTGTATITATQDSLDEDDETVVIDIASVTSGTENGTQSRSVTITDDDAPPTVTLTVSASSIAEAAGVSTVTATLSTASSRTVTVNLAYGGTAAGSGVDYTAAATTISITAGSTTGTTTVTAVQDSLNEDVETVIIDIASVANGTESGTQSQTVSITDDDALPSVTLSATPMTISEAGGQSSVTATLSAVSGRAVTVQLAYGGTATGSGTDYTAAASIVVPAGSTSAAMTLTASDDALDEVNETIVIDVSGVTNGTETVQQQQTLTVTDNDAAPSVVFTSASQSGGESGSLTVTAQLSAASGQSITVPYTVGGTASGSGTDYSLSPGSPLTFSAGETSKTITITVTGDTTDEYDETVILTLGSPTNATLGATMQHTATVLDDDAEPTVGFTMSGQSSPGEVGSLSAMVQVSAQSGKDITIPYTVNASSTAVGGVDYTIAPVGTLTIPAGSASATITITLVDDAIDENNETVVVNLGTPTNAGLGGTTQHTATITDNDAAPVVSMASVSQVKGEPSGSASITVSLSAASGLGVTVPYAVTGTAHNPADYTISASPLVIPAGSTSGTITVSIVNDSATEGSTPETVIVTLDAAPTNATRDGTQYVHTLAITDDESTPTLSIADVSVNEGAGTATVSVTITVPLGGTVPATASVVYATGDGSALAGNDYTTTSGSLSWANGDSSGTAKTFTIPITSDTLDEDEETLLVLLSNPVGSGLNDDQATVTITDDDAVPTVAFQLSGQSPAESAGSATITVTMSPVSGRTVSVPFSIAGASTATAADYSVSTASPLVIPAGSTSATIAVTLMGDALDENDETIVVQLGSPTNATVSGGDHTLTITDDDAQPTVTLSTGSASIFETSGSTPIIASLNAVSGAYRSVSRWQPLAAQPP